MNEVIISEPFEGSAWLDIIERGLQAQIRLVLLVVVVLEAACLFKQIKVFLSNLLEFMHLILFQSFEELEFVFVTFLQSSAICIDEIFDCQVFNILFPELGDTIQDLLVLLPLHFLEVFESGCPCMDIRKAMGQRDGFFRESFDQILVDDLARRLKSSDTLNQSAVFSLAWLTIFVVFRRSDRLVFSPSCDSQITRN